MTHSPSTPPALLAAIVLFAAITPAVLMTAPALAAQLASQWQLSPGQIGDLFSAELGAMSLATLPAIWWLKRVNWRLAALLAGALFVTGNLASAWAEGYTTLVILRFLTALAGGSLMILCLSSAATTDNPSRVYGLWVMGQLVLGAIGLALLPKLFASQGLASGYLLLAALGLLVLPLARAFPSGAQSPAQARSEDYGAPPLRVGLGILGLLGFYIALSGVWTFIGAMGESAGLDAQANGNVLAIATLMGILGAVIAVVIGERLPRVPSLWLGFGLMALSTLLLLGQPQLARFAIAALVFKFTWTYVLPFILACLADLDPSGRLMNLSNLVIGGGLALGPALAGRLIERQGGFDGLLLAAAAITLLSLLALLGSRERGRAVASFDSH
ncbi:MFS transporter [Metapseudomonas furukawaii]|uniref:MFS transporter n=1 Tax=Metapseudomonas furukawaii TaxID=1149133 RepID=UPI00227A24E1|nr:MFS transporter [Pseudomonas furukawaii]WAG76916.1 MFS transporter [Pseudomonas furukawaii]